MAITFAVDDVAPAVEPRATRALRELAPDALLVSGDGDARIADHEGVHPLLWAVHIAFAEHRRLVLSPDAIWLTIAQGLAQHVRLNAERLRPRLVRHAGRRTIEVEWNGPPPREREQLEQVVDSFRSGLAEEIGSGVAALFVCDFSTSTSVERIASEVVLLDAFSPYFDLSIACICGIPEVTLLGEPADYREIRERIDVLTELDLDFWRPSLVAIADGLVASSEGRPDREFWRRIYKPREAYGWDLITGWIARLYPYLKSCQRVTERNPLLGQPFSFDPPKKPNEHWYSGPGVTTGDVPATLSRVLIDVHDRTTTPPNRFELSIEAGLTHVEQDAAGCLVPRAGYCVRERKLGIHEIIERIAREHRSVPASSPCPDIGAPGEVTALYDHFHSFTLFEGPREWRLLPVKAVELPCDLDNVIHVASEPYSFHLLPLMDLPDGRVLCSVWVGYACVSASDVKFEAGGKEGVDEVTGLTNATRDRWFMEVKAEKIPVVGRSLSALLGEVLDKGAEVSLGRVCWLSEVEFTFP